MQTLYNQGGFDAIDETWANRRNPPSTFCTRIAVAGDMPQLVSIAPLTDTLEPAGGSWIKMCLASSICASTWSRSCSPQVDSAPLLAGVATSMPSIGMKTRMAGDGAAAAGVGFGPRWRGEFATALADYTTASYGGPGRVESDGGVCWQGSDVTCFTGWATRASSSARPTLAMAAASHNAAANNPQLPPAGFVIPKTRPDG